MKTIAELHIQDWTDRQNVVAALANAGYFVAVEQREKNPYSVSREYYVIVKAGEEGA